jgi:membrane AbrB-like protein
MELGTSDRRSGIGSVEPGSDRTDQWTRWALLILLSAALGGLLEWVGLPAAFLLGPMIAAILLALRGGSLRVSAMPFAGAQALVGCLVAGTLDAGTFATAAGDWPIFLVVTATTLGASSVLGYLLSRWQVLPGTAAIWGSAPGAATAMVLMAQAYGADARLVAVMTYLRVVCVALVAALLAAALTGHAHSHAAGWSLAVDPVPLVETLAVAAVGAALGTWLRLPAGALLGAILLATALNLAGLLHPSLPLWLLAPAYAVIGWKIGLSFNREAIAVAARALPRLLLSIGLLILFCAGLGALLSRLTGIDPVTAFLATSPGGLDSVAIVASSTPVDVPFVMAMQAVRFVAVLLAGPPLARFVADRRTARLQPPAAD